MKTQKLNAAGETPAMSKAREREEYWAYQRYISSTCRQIEHARRMEKKARDDYWAAHERREANK